VEKLNIPWKSANPSSPLPNPATNVASPLFSEDSPTKPAISGV
jgi:hypothetical protein